MSTNQWKSNQQWGADQRGRSGGWQEHRSGDRAGDRSGGWETDHRSDRSGGCAGDRSGNWAGDHSGGWATDNRNHRSGGWAGDHSSEWKKNYASWDQPKEEWNTWPEVKSDWAGQASGWGQWKNDSGATGSGSPIDEDDPRWDTVVEVLGNYRFQQIEKQEAKKDAAAVAAQAEPWPAKIDSAQNPWDCLSTPDASTDGAAVAAPQSRRAAQQEGPPQAEEGPRQEDAAQQESAPQEGLQQEGPQQNGAAVAAPQDGGGAQRDGAAVAAPQNGAVQANDVLAALEADGMIQAYELTVADNGRFCFDIPYFEGYRAFSDGYKQHNLSLKYFREAAENKESPMSSFPLKFPFDGWVSTKAVVHEKEGMGYTFSDDVIWWNWHELVAQLETESMQYVVDGPEGRSGGLIGCEFATRPNSYDHKRHHMMKMLKKNPQDASGNKKVVQLPVWDFLIRRADGTACRLHPEYSNTWIECVEVGDDEITVNPPVAGLGCSDGPGTYKSKTLLPRSRKLRFNARKRP